ncbi:hypothetical protein ABB34_13885 [Stenotrophomonas daejeonensis]|uniref:Membrane protease subunit n=1 Tax=Stenotrophomonas daejeonensis TaxID=659018 RepID=A0A0R0DXG3_9GAMM|nr:MULTISPECIES: hypothetical protein [Stenotrophomonas]KRG82099.1 hypothetical protein ABB34_13885 [Stenotrophomonas daejeonensis]MCG8277563.1 hypothetical protein [Stenotrophomonas sp. NLF4-10]
MRQRERGSAQVGVWVVTGLVALVLVGTAWAVPRYRVYAQELRGKAALVEAESNRRIAVLEAEAARDAAVALAAAEIERAKGVAEANRIIGDSLKGNEGYLRYLYIDALKTTPNQTIYIPTEAGLPILEAQRKALPAQ